MTFKSFYEKYKGKTFQKKTNFNKPLEISHLQLPQ